jgi:hypothetical protein
MIGFAIYRKDGTILITNNEKRAIEEVLLEKYLHPKECYPVVRILR